MYCSLVCCGSYFISQRMKKSVKMKNDRQNAQRFPRKLCANSGQWFHLIIVLAVGQRITPLCKIQGYRKTTCCVWQRKHKLGTGWKTRQWLDCGKLLCLCLLVIRKWQLSSANVNWRWLGKAWEELADSWQWHSHWQLLQCDIAITDGKGFV